MKRYLIQISHRPHRPPRSPSKSGVRAGDWLGCGRVITQESWDRFLKAQHDYWEAKDKEKADADAEKALSDSGTAI